MPKKANPESPEDQAKRFREKVQELVDAGELNPTDADAALDKLLRRSRASPAP
jgi:polyhydroxyalkanoate synthesis regulator phasin